MVDMNNKYQIIPATEYDYYFAVYGEKTVIEGNNDFDNVTCEDLYQIFKSRLLSEGIKS